MCVIVHPRRSANASRRGFTLIETALATIIIGVGVMAVVQLLAKSTASQAAAVDMTIAVTLANNIHELTYNLKFYDPVTPTQWGPRAGETLATYDDITDLDGQVFSPPIDGHRQTLTQYPNWTQSVVVQSVDPNRLTTVVPNGTTQIDRVTVTISHLGSVVYQETWLNVYPY